MELLDQEVCTFWIQIETTTLERNCAIIRACVRVTVSLTLDSVNSHYVSQSKRRKHYVSVILPYLLLNHDVDHLFICLLAIPFFGSKWKHEMILEMKKQNKIQIFKRMKMRNLKMKKKRRNIMRKNKGKKLRPDYYLFIYFVWYWMIWEFWIVVSRLRVKYFTKITNYTLAYNSVH